MNGPQVQDPEYNAARLIAGLLAIAGLAWAERETAPAPPAPRFDLSAEISHDVFVPIPGATGFHLPWTRGPGGCSSR